MNAALTVRCPTNYWADEFDADLHRVVPGAREALGIDAGVPVLLLHAQRNDGFFVMPSCWTDYDVEHVTPVFLDERAALSFTANPMGLDVVRVTFEDLWRDAWVHNYGARIGGTHDGPWLLRADRLTHTSMSLMFHLRGALALSPREVFRAQDRTCRAIRRSRVALHAALRAQAMREVEERHPGSVVQPSMSRLRGVYCPR